MLYSNYHDDDGYYSSYGPSYQRPLSSVGPSNRRRPPPPPQDPSHLHYYHRHRDDRDGWSAPGPDVIPPQLSRRQTSMTTNGTSDYSAGSRPRRGRSKSATRAARSMSSSPHRHSTPIPPAPPIPQPSLSERETLARQRLRTTFETYVFNTLPTHLLRVADMTLVTRNEIWETFKSRFESPSESNLSKLVLEQDEEARKLGVSVLDPQVQTPFSDYVRSVVNFAVFSHKWGNGELLFHELPSKRHQVTRRPASGPGYQKLSKFCEKARADYGCEYAWVDTCCINKESSADVEEAVLSMGVWYSEAGICIVHLGNSSSLDDFMSEPWFTRGWTLPELLLPRRIRFYGKDWSPICPATAEARREDRTAKDARDDQRINDKDNDALVAALAQATSIPEPDLRHFTPGCTRVAEKMRWAAQRTTSRTEDVAYCLLALFDVTLPVAYGEGARAFDKLMRALAAQCTDPDLFAWGGKPSAWSLALPSSPQCYAPQATMQTQTQTQTQTALVTGAPGGGDPAYELVKLGLRVRLVLVPTYSEPLETTADGHVRYLLTPALATAQEAIQAYVPFATGPHVPSQGPTQTQTQTQAQGYGSGQTQGYGPGQAQGYGSGQAQGYGSGQAQGQYGPSSSAAAAAAAGRPYDYEHDDAVPPARTQARGDRGDRYGSGQGQGQYGPSSSSSSSAAGRPYEYEHDDAVPPARAQGRDRGEREREHGYGAATREREFALGILDYDPRHGRPGYAALHAGRVHLALVLERERRGRGWIRVARPGVVNLRFRESELGAVESVCVLHRA